MKPTAAFVPIHLNANANDLAGNDGIGRYILLPGSTGRAKEISQYFDHLRIKTHPRGHDLYLGTLQNKGQSIDVGTIASGMGCPSMEIILHELFHLGAKRFLRVGTAGSLQPDLLKPGDLVNVQAAVRDEKTTEDYAPPNVPAIASFDLISAISQAVKKMKLTNQCLLGTVHCKSSLYAREFGCGPNSEANQAYINWLRRYGILASEMEVAALFIQSQFYHYQLMQQGQGPAFRVLCGAILGIMSTIGDQQFVFLPEEERVMKKNMIELAIESVKLLAASEA